MFALLFTADLSGGEHAAALSAAFTAATVSAREHTPAAMWVIFPKDVTPRAAGTDYVDAAARVLSARTRIALSSAERAGADVARIKSCDPAERYHCWLSALRPETRYLFVVAVQPIEPTAEAVSLIFIDAEQARERTAALTDTETIESEIFNLSVRAPAIRVDSLSPGALEKWFAERLEGPLRAQLKKNGDLEPFGKIRLHAPAPGWPITLDGEMIASTSSTADLITDLAPGVRRLSMIPPGAAPFTRDIRVEPSKTATIAFGVEPMSADPPGEERSMRYGLIFGGIAASSIGGVLLASAVSRASNIRQTCISRAGDSMDAGCEQRGAITLGHDAAKVPSFDPRAVNPGGVAVAPLAIGLIGGGAIIAAGTYLLRDFERDWWWPLVSGLGFFAASYGVGILVDGR